MAFGVPQRILDFLLAHEAELLDVLHQPVVIVLHVPRALRFGDEVLPARRARILVLIPLLPLAFHALALLDVTA